MRTKQAEFHPMRGHVVDGMEIEFPGGHVLTLRSHMVAWELIANDGVRVGRLMASAAEVAQAIQEFKSKECVA